MNAPVLITHPPGTIISEDIVKLFLEALVVIPGFIFISELTSPLSLAPRVPYSNKLQSIDIANVQDTICMIEQDSGLSRSILLVSILVLHNVSTTD